MHVVNCNVEISFKYSMCSELPNTVNQQCCDYRPQQGRAETFGGAGAQSIKGAHGTRLLIGLCSLLICVSKWMLLYWYSSKCHDAGLKKKHRTEKTILSLNVKRHFLHLLITLEWYYYCCCCCYWVYRVWWFCCCKHYCCCCRKKIFLSYLK